jgi:ADP-ribose pyrophosphatase YjhB (NUDIX family)
MRRVDQGTDKTAARTYRDASGRALRDYPRPSVAVDTALLTVQPTRSGLRLVVLQVRRGDGHSAGEWALPGTFLHEGERLIDAVHRSLREKAGVQGASPRQLHVFDDPTRDDRGWVLSVAHADVVRHERLGPALDSAGVRLADATSPGPVPYDHRAIVRYAVEDLRARYRTAPDPAGLLPPEFTLRELRLVHEAVTGHALQRDTFRRSVADQLEPTGTFATGITGRPAELFRRTP